ncbi:DUF6412 domain-containing protein [Micromonospora sp. NPDC049301]|uniref:DUF6412 domain-containing protein n=1 Tax=Micromonospora sp. NPDC049301 TaxID=3155723 RepID=UPI003420D262
MPVPLGLFGAAWIYVFTQLTTLAARPADLLAGAALTALVLLAVLLAARMSGRSGASGIGRRGTGLLARSRGRRVPRQVDPDAAGRPRPRAPGRPSAA